MSNKEKPFPVCYFDSSVILSILLENKGALLTGYYKIYSFELSEIEVIRTLEKERFTQKLTEGEFALKCNDAFNLFKGLYIIRSYSEIFERAKIAFAFPVRALDSIHIAAAEWLQQQIKDTVAFFTYDKRQAQAAVSRGLHVIEH